ncbi:MAG: zinc ribbon domain-containing protein [Methanobacteriaceae archaeon]|nr:zinc ribbon domain-containing protein [Methanobacteriaceae archaeon]
MSKKCPKCNSNVKLEAKFCENCGYKFSNQVKKDFDLFKDDWSQLNKRQLRKELKNTRKTNIGLGVVGGKFILGIVLLLIIIIIAILFYNMTI